MDSVCDDSNHGAKEFSNNITEQQNIQNLGLHTTHAIQIQFAEHIRNPQKTSKPNDVPNRRMQIYRDLFYKNIEGFISNGFPVLRTIVSDEHWHAMIRDFMTQHYCKTPYFPEVSEEFLEYLQLGRQTNDIDPPFLIELAHYEWVELAIDIAQEALPNPPELHPIDNPDDEQSKECLIKLIEHGQLAISPLAWSLTYQWPVHHLSASYQPEQPPDNPTYLLVYRNRRDMVKFMELNPVTARLISLIKESQGQDTPISGQQAIAQIQIELEKIVEPDAVYRGGIETLLHLYNVDALLVSK